VGSVERGSATRSGFAGSETFGLSDDVNSDSVLRLRAAPQGEAVENICGVGLRTCCGWGVATAALQPQRGCSIQPSVGAKRPRWVNGQNEYNSDLSSLGNCERNSPKPKARKGRASGRERVHELNPEWAVERMQPLQR
jgi:hypothetical protein